MMGGTECASLLQLVGAVCACRLDFIHLRAFPARSMAQAHLDIQHTAKLARLQLTDGEAVKFTAQIESILDYMRTLEAHDLSGVEPTAHAMPVYDVWRDDEPRESFTNEQSLANAPKKSQGQFLMPRVVEE